MESINVKIINKSKHATPSYETAASAGMDLRAAVEQDTVIDPGETLLIPTGLSIYVEDPNMAAVILPRSGLGHKHGIVLGNLVGAGLDGKILIIDDVITAGTAIRESVDIISQAGATLSGVVIALDRQERGRDQRSAIQEVEETLGIKVTSIVTLADLLDYLRDKPGHGADLENIEQYREQYGI